MLTLMPEGNNFSIFIFLYAETLRKWPPVSNLYRVANKDYRIPGTDVVIEKGLHIQVPVYAIHHDPGKLSGIFVRFY